MADLVYYIATSLDGFIADPDGGFEGFVTEPATVAWLFDRYPETCPAHLREALGVAAQPRRFDRVIMGARTHQPALDAGLTSAYPHLQQYVVTHRELPDDPTVHTINGDVHRAVAQLKTELGRDIWLCGGADIAAQTFDLIDELQVKVNPVLFGSGVPLTRLAYEPRAFSLQSSETLPGGVVFTTYRRV